MPKLKLKLKLKPKRSRKANTSHSRSHCLRDWLELPPDVTASILLRLGAIEIIQSAQKVCTQWRNICKDPSMWRSIDMRNSGDSHFYDLEKICMHAIDRSCGGLVDINIEYFDERLSEAAKKFPLLEELEIYSGGTGKAAIEAVGRCCPLLKTFKFNEEGDPSYQYDEEALAIAENMHGLCHLQLVGNNLTNHGLQAILDGCHSLESLDLRRCFHVNLEGDIGRRCAEQIKNLRHLNDSVHDFEFSEEVDSSEYSDFYYPSDFSYDDYGLGYDYDAYDGFDGYDSDFNVSLI